MKPVVVASKNELPNIFFTAFNVLNASGKKREALRMKKEFLSSNNANDAIGKILKYVDLRIL